MRHLFLAALLAGCPPTVLDDTDDDTDNVFIDVDGDGFTSNVDCDDADDAIFPGADELCNGIDDDCDGTVDEDAVDRETVWEDGDGDGYGDPSTEQQVCDFVDDLHVSNGDDCDDNDADINPDAQEVCDPDDVDEDCDGLADDADDSTAGSSKGTWYADGDGDGFGDPGASRRQCDASAGWVSDNTDCDDADASANPDLGCPGPWDGVWDGRVRLDIAIPSLGVSDYCEGTGRLVIEAGAADELTTEGGRPWSCSGDMAAGTVAMSGSFVDADTIEGVFDLDGESFDFTAELSEADGLVATGVESRTVEGFALTIEHELTATPAR